MAIDDLTLARQRLESVPTRHPEVKCECGERTRDATGICRACRIEFPKVASLRLESLLKLRAAVESEIRRRRDDLSLLLRDT